MKEKFNEKLDTLLQQEKSSRREKVVIVVQFSPRYFPYNTRRWIMPFHQYTYLDRETCAVRKPILYIVSQDGTEPIFGPAVWKISDS